MWTEKTENEACPSDVPAIGPRYERGCEHASPLPTRYKQLYVIQHVRGTSRGDNSDLRFSNLLSLDASLDEVFWMLLHRTSDIDVYLILDRLLPMPN